MPFHVHPLLLPTREGARHGYYRPGSGRNYYDPPQFERFYKPTETWGVMPSGSSLRVLRPRG